MKGGEQPWRFVQRLFARPAAKGGSSGQGGAEGAGLARLFKPVAVVLALALLLGLSLTVADVAKLRDENPTTSSLLKLRSWQSFQRGQATRHQLGSWLDYNDIDSDLRRAVVLAEDDRFWTHFGLDLRAIFDAAKRNERAGQIRRGGSTITQQLAKNLFLSPRRSYLRKLREAVIASVMELILSKRRILEIYLNVIEFGPAVYGVEAGAQHHLDRSARDLSPQQAALLAALIPSPLRWTTETSLVRQRADRLQTLLQRGAGREPRRHP